MDLVQVAFRIVHIGAAIIWAGGAALFTFYLEPTIAKLGPDAEKFVDELVNRRKIPVYFAVASTLTVLFGAFLYWRVSGGLQAAWITSPMGIVLTVGAISALIAWAGGNLLIPRTFLALVATGAELKKAAGPPPPELLARMHGLQERLRKIGMVDMVLIAIAVVGMASARYVG